MKEVQHIFFDLDKTLWDFETNSREALKDIFIDEDLKEKGIDDFNQFYQIYAKINEQCWDLYRQNLMNKAYLRYQRFYLTLKYFNIDNRRLAKIIGEAYVEISPKKTALIPGTKALLDYLSERHLLHIITNGFEEVQYQKLHNTGIKTYFQHIITSEKAGRRKPDPKIFRFALQQAGVKADQTVMIGDDYEIDIQGALKSGIKAIWYNPSQSPILQEDIHVVTDLLNICKLFP